jgi:CarD family transcriptional regulator
MPKNWNRRFKHNRDKMKTGDIFELAEVVRNLSLRDHEKGLSTGEKQMFVKAKKILASELMYAKSLEEDAAAEWLDEVLSTNGKSSTSTTDGPSTNGTNGIKKKAATPKTAATKSKSKAGAAA